MYYLLNTLSSWHGAQRGAGLVAAVTSWWHSSSWQAVLMSFGRDHSAPSLTGTSHTEISPLRLPQRRQHKGKCAQAAKGPWRMKAPWGTTRSCSSKGTGCFMATIRLLYNATDLKVPCTKWGADPWCLAHEHSKAAPCYYSLSKGSGSECRACWTDEYPEEPAAHQHKISSWRKEILWAGLTPGANWDQRTAEGSWVMLANQLTDYDPNKSLIVCRNYYVYMFDPILNS